MQGYCVIKTITLSKLTFLCKISFNLKRKQLKTARNWTKKDNRFKN